MTDGKDNGLDKETTEKLKSDLLARKEQIERDLEDVAGESNGGAEHDARFPDYGDKLDENAQEVGEYTTNLATKQVLEDTLRDINNALDRMEKGVYGVCKYCKREIGRKRLLARPVASACVECKTRLQGAA